jgi:hypothetical protein
MVGVPMLALMESQGFVSAQSSAPEPSPANHGSALIPSVVVPAIISVLSYIALKQW